MKKVMSYQNGATKSYVDVSTEGQLYAACVRILTSRHAKGFFNKPIAPADPEITAKKIAKSDMPKMVKEFAKNLVANYNTQMKIYNEKQERYNMLLTALEEKNGVKCLEIMEENKFKDGLGFDIYEVEGGD